MQRTDKMLQFKTADGQDIKMPVVPLKGDKEGPHVVITAGIHGCEYPPLLAFMEFLRDVKPEEVLGTITIVTIATIPAFESRTPFVNPIDGINPNRAFPGKEDGTYTECLTYHLFNDVIKGADYHLDLHCGDMTETLAPYCEYGIGYSEKVDRMSKEIALYSGVNTLVESDYNRDDIGLPPGLNYINSVQHGIASAIFEFGQMGRYDREYIDGQLFFLRNVMRHFGNLAGEAIPTENQQQFVIYVEIDAPVTGIFVRCVEAGDDLKKGDKVGDMYDYFGNHLCDVRCEIDGRILYLNSSIAVQKDGFILNMVY